MKSIVLTLSAFFIISCTSPVEKYIRENEQNLQTLEIISESEIDSVYSPYEELKKLLSRYNAFSVEFTDIYAQALQAKSKKDMTCLLDSASKLRNRFENEISEKRHSCFSAIDYGALLSTTKNSASITVKYRLNGILLEKIFYYDKYGACIEYSDDDLRKLAEKVYSEWKTNLDLENEIFNKKIEVESGAYDRVLK